MARVIHLGSVTQHFWKIHIQSEGDMPKVSMRDVNVSSHEFVLWTEAHEFADTLLDDPSLWLRMYFNVSGNVWTVEYFKWTVTGD
jgi:hypothetical protein